MNELKHALVAVCVAQPFMVLPGMQLKPSPNNYKIAAANSLTSTSSSMSTHIQILQRYIPGFTNM